MHSPAAVPAGAGTHLSGEGRQPPPSDCELAPWKARHGVPCCPGNPKPLFIANLLPKNGSAAGGGGWQEAKLAFTHPWATLGAQPRPHGARWCGSQEPTERAAAAVGGEPWEEGEETSADGNQEPNAVTSSLLMCVLMEKPLTFFF